MQNIPHLHIKEALINSAPPS